MCLCTSRRGLIREKSIVDYQDKSSFTLSVAGNVQLFNIPRPLHVSIFIVLF